MSLVFHLSGPCGNLGRETPNVTTEILGIVHRGNQVSQSSLIVFWKRADDRAVAKDKFFVVCGCHKISLAQRLRQCISQRLTKFLHNGHKRTVTFSAELR